MNRIEHRNIAVTGSKGRKTATDIIIPVSKRKVPVVVFCHGFKGFKDWGHFNWLAEQFATQGLAFVKFNFSHNGSTMQQPEEVSDLDAFSENNYTMELADAGLILDWLENECPDRDKLDMNQIGLLGHSRGGGIVLIKAANDKRVKKAAVWASLSDFGKMFRPETIAQWEKDGVVYAENKRTKQQLPLKKQFYDDYLAHKDALDVLKACKLIEIPLLIVHGDKDETVPVQHALDIYNTVLHSILIRVEEGDHTFSAKHPFNPDTDVTTMLEELVENTTEFFID